MDNTSAEWKEKIYEDVQSITKIFFDGVLINSDYILEIEKGGTIFDEEFSLGSTPSQYINMKIYKGELKIPKEITIEYGIQINEEFETISLGKYNVDDYTDNDDETITIKALDNMIKFEFNYDGSSLIYPTNLAVILYDICNKAGVELRFYFFFRPRNRSSSI